MAPRPRGESTLMCLRGRALALALAGRAATEKAVAAIAVVVTGVVAADGSGETAAAFAGNVVAFGLGDILALQLVAAAFLLAAAGPTMFATAPLVSSFDFYRSELGGVRRNASGGERLDGAAAREVGNERPGQAIEAVAVHGFALSEIEWDNGGSAVISPEASGIPNLHPRR